MVRKTFRITFSGILSSCWCSNASSPSSCSAAYRSGLTSWSWPSSTWPRLGRGPPLVEASPRAAPRQLPRSRAREAPRGSPLPRIPGS